jgi:chromosome partitioning protein
VLLSDAINERFNYGRNSQHARGLSILKDSQADNVQIYPHRRNSSFQDGACLALSQGFPRRLGERKNEGTFTISHQGVSMKKPVIISVINHKGGVGKTTTTVNIAAGLARLGKKVLAVDLDTQMNLTHSLVGDLSEEELTVAEAILNPNVCIKRIIKPTKVENLEIAPSGESMVDLELKLHSAFGRESLLKRILHSEKLRDYDYIILDNQPHLGLTTVNGLIACNYYLVPVSTEYLPMVGLKHLLKTIDQIRPLNSSIRNLGYLLTMVDRREGISKDVEKILRKNFPDEVFKNVVRINTKLKACPQKKQTIFDAEGARGKGYTDYANVTKELLDRLENK